MKIYGTIWQTISDGNINKTSVKYFSKLPAMVLAWENLQEVFAMLVVVVLHSLLFDVVPRPSVSYCQVFTPILYFQPSSSQSDSRHFHFNLYGPFCYSFTASATDLRERFSLSGVFYLTLLPNIWHNLLLWKFPWELAFFPWRLQGHLLRFKTQTRPICLFKSQSV